MRKVVTAMALALAFIALLIGVLWLYGARSGTIAETLSVPGIHGPGATGAPAASSRAPFGDISNLQDEGTDPLLDPNDPLADYEPTPVPPGPAATARFENPRRAHLTFELTVTNDGPGAVESLELFVAVPSDRDNQRISGLQFSSPYTLLTDRYGQQVARFGFANLAPGQQARVAWEGDVEVWAIDYHLDPAQAGTMADIPPDVVRLYTSDEDKYGLSSSTIQRAARAAAGGATDPYGIARNVHDYVARHLGYLNDGIWVDAETVYRNKSGSCSEYTFLFIALARANGLPARYVAGTRQRQDGYYVDRLFHRWAEVYLPPYGWVPVDTLSDDRAGGPFTYFFGAVTDERFVTTVGGGDSEYLGWNYHYGYQYEATVGEPHLTRARRFTWQP